MSSYATVDDVRARWDGDAPDARIQAHLDDAETILLADKIPDLAARIADGRTSAAMLRLVLVRVVTRYLDNPQGYVGEHAGEVGYYRAQGQKVAPLGRVDFTEDDLSALGLDFSYQPRSIRLAVPDYCGSPPVRRGGW